jgi:hypothetical protein
MTSIHHATAKRAAEAGITLEILDDAGIIRAKQGDGPAVWHTKAGITLDAAILQRTLEAEYPAIGFGNAQDEDTGIDIGFHAYSATGDDAGAPFAQWDHVPDIADVLDEAIAHDIDPEEGAEQGTGPVIVVAPKYKRRYAEGGHPEHCGDWLAYQLEGVFQLPPSTPNGNPVFDVDAFASCLVANGVELVGKWAALPTSGQAGWQGRYRMNGRQKLEQQVAASGELILDGATIPVDPDALEVLRTKHPKWAPKGE